MNLASLLQDSQHAVLMQRERPDRSRSVSQIVPITSRWRSSVSAKGARGFGSDQMYSVVSAFRSEHKRTLATCSLGEKSLDSLACESLACFKLSLHTLANVKLFAANRDFFTVTILERSWVKTGVSTDTSRPFPSIRLRGKKKNVQMLLLWLLAHLKNSHRGT